MEFDKLSKRVIGCAMAGVKIGLLMNCNVTQLRMASDVSFPDSFVLCACRLRRADRGRGGVFDGALVLCASTATNAQTAGGHRVPFIARWPGRFPPRQEPGRMTNATVILATLASMIGYELPDDVAVDSCDMLLFNLATDPVETTNLFSVESARREQTQSRLRQLTEPKRGRSAPRNRKPLGIENIHHE